MTPAGDRPGPPGVEEHSPARGWARRALHGGGGTPGAAWRAVAAPLGWAWDRLAERRLESPGPAVRLDAPVVSVGNVTVGGGGKTSLVKWIVEAGSPAGSTVAVLTRGYGREGDASLVVAPGGTLPGGGRPHAADLALRAGDEPVLLARAGAWVAVGADRVRAARALGRHVDPDLLLLDDGLQHRRIARSLDLVAFTADDLDGPARCLPAGPLRQGPGWMPKVGAWVVTGADPREAAWPAGTIGAAFDPWWKAMPGFPAGWTDAGTVSLGAWHAGTDEPLAPDGRPAVAFAGVARPESVAAFARRAGFEVGRIRAFPDHHRYGPRDAAALLEADPAATLLTTEKDAVKLRPEWFGDRPVGVQRRARAPQDPDRLRGLIADASGRSS